MLCRLLLLTSVLLSAAVPLLNESSEDVILPAPPGKTGTPIILLHSQGAQIAPAAYTSLLSEIQQQLNQPLWVAAPHFPLGLDLCPALAATALTRALSSLRAAGAPNDARVFYSGHSLGAANLQQLVRNEQLFQDLPQPQALLLFGAMVSRQWENATQPFPTLAICGELDGLCKLLRSAEAFYHLVDDGGNTHSPPIVIPGMSHMQFATGPAPHAVKAFDLKPEISDDEARQSVAKIATAFISQNLGGEGGDIIASAIASTYDLVTPAIAMLQLESSHFLQRPCNSDHPAPHCPFYPAWPTQSHRTPATDDNCVCGTPWVADVAMPTMASLPNGFRVSDVDAQHDVTDTHPYHHGHLWNNCTESTAHECSLNLTTVSQVIYDKHVTTDAEPLPFLGQHVSAREIRAKMVSRQLMYMATVDPNAQLKDTDHDTNCAAINQKAYDAALGSLSPLARQRFSRVGQPMVMGKDIRPLLPIGPVFIKDTLHLDNQRVDGATVLVVRSPALVTGVDSWITHLYPDSSGYHYCKLLSPARALEWVQTDGLRLHGGIA